MAEQSDMGAHEGTYSGFIWLLKWGTIIAAAITAFVVWLIAS